MFDLLQNTSLICNANQLSGFCLIRIFTQYFFKTGCWNLGFNSNNSTKYIETSFQKKSVINMTKFVSVKKIHTKLIFAKRNFAIMIWDFFFIQKSMTWLVRVYIRSSLCITKTGNWGNSKFWTFVRCSRLNLPSFFAILVTHLKGKNVVAE